MKLRTKFVLDVVESAVALPQSDPQDRLRVLASAAGVVGGISQAKARMFAREGIQLEMRLISSGQTPAVSLLQQGPVDCPLAQEFVDTIPLASVPRAEQSIIGALTACQSQTLDSIKRKLRDALKNGIIAPRALLAVIDVVGVKTQWSAESFAELFNSLPKDAENFKTEAPNFAAMFARIAREIEPSAARTSGLNFLEWLGRLPESDERSLAVNIANSVLKEVLGEEKYREALSSNVMAMGVAQSAGKSANIRHNDEESVSVMRAFSGNGEDRTDVLRDLPSSMRAREAAAHGFAAGTSAKRELSDKYFDMAFSALNEVWDSRASQRRAADVVEEVSEAAAQVDSVAALKRAQGLDRPAAQAISMLAVARVVLTKQVHPPRPSPPGSVASPQRQ
jgi:hypothetical protein